MGTDLEFPRSGTSTLLVENELIALADTPFF
jgi:hypothetical protein